MSWHAYQQALNFSGGKGKGGGGWFWDGGGGKAQNMWKGNPNTKGNGKKGLDGKQGKNGKGGGNNLNGEMRRICKATGRTRSLATVAAKQII